MSSSALFSDRRLLSHLPAIGALVVGCSSSSPPSGAAADASTDVGVKEGGADGGGPVISNPSFQANPNNVLSGTLTFTTNEPTTDQVQVNNESDGGADNSFSIPLAGATPVTSHSIRVLGLRSSSSFHIAITTTDAASRTATATVDVTTAPLPAGIAPLTVVTNDKTKTSPGFTMLNPWGWTADQPFAKQDGTSSSVVIVDADGQVVWYWLGNASVIPEAPVKLPNGDIAFIASGPQTAWEEIDMMGNVVRLVPATQMGLDSLHHEIFPEPDAGSFLALSPELRSVSGFGDAGATTYSVVGDVIAEFGLDGGVAHRWSDFDMLDPHYEGDTSLFNYPYWNSLYRDAGATKDWTHGNAAVVDPTDGNIVASARTLSWIYKFDRNDGGAPKLLWRLGPNGDFTLTNASDGFQYNQHGATVLPDGNVMCFDNGDDRANDAGVAGLYSRAVEFSLDTTNKTATIVWQYRETPSFYSSFLGSSYLLPNGNVLVCDGAEVADRSTSYADPTNLKSARIMEVTHDPVPTKVMELDLNVPSSWAPNFSGFTVYRARRISSIY